MKIKPWLEFFRLPNLVTAPGDALAGAAFASAFAAVDFSVALAAGAAVLFLYMFGLADNDIVGAKTEEDAAAGRVIPRGAISLFQARVARGLCVVAAASIGIIAALPQLWWIVASVLMLAIVFYNRVKNKWIMGGCRALSVLSGAAAFHLPEFGGRAVMTGVGMMFVGWMCYIAAVTKLSEGEEAESEGLSPSRYVIGVSSLIPLGACFYLPEASMSFMPVMGCLFAFVSWCVTVAPLGAPHASSLRRSAVGNAIRSLLFLQAGFMLVNLHSPFAIAALILWPLSRIIRRLAPSVTGS